MSRSDKYKMAAKNREVDLIPFMNLIAILIPVLLVSMEYIHIAKVLVSMPQAGAQGAKDKKEFTLMLMAGGEGFYITSGDKKEPTKVTVPKTRVVVYKVPESSGNFMKEVLRVWRTGDDMYKSGVRHMSKESKTELVSDLKQRYGALNEMETIDYDYPALQKKLIEIKKLYPTESKIIIGANSEVEYQTLVHMMDAARQYIDEKGTKKSLFPQVALSGGVS